MNMMENITANTTGAIAGTRFLARYRRIHPRRPATLHRISLITSTTAIITITGTIGTTGTTSITVNTMTVNTSTTVASRCLPAVSQHQATTHQVAQFPHNLMRPPPESETHLKHPRHLCPISLQSLRICIMDLTHLSLIRLVSCLQMVLAQQASAPRHITLLTGLLAHIQWTARSLVAL
jgi:hypothetical protein